MSRRDAIDTFVENLVRIGIDQLDSELGAPRDRAESAMRRVAAQLCAAYAGRPMYVPVAFDPRNREIVEKYGRQGRTARAFSPERVIELAAEYELSERRIYGILAEARAEEFSARQGVLPGLDEPTDSPA